MTFEMYVDPGNRKVEIHIDEINYDTRKAIRKAFYHIGKDLVKETKNLIMQKPKHGRLYRLRLGGRMFSHRSSAPGEAPANFTGSLKNSIDFDVIGSDKLEFGSKNIFENRKGKPSGVDYGKYLEGDENAGSTKLAPRPFLLPSIKKNERNAEKHFNQQIKNALEGAR